MNSLDELWQNAWQNVQEIGPLTYTRYRLILHELPKPLHQNIRIIDVGCGNGNFLSIFKKRYPNAYLRGIEYSKNAIQAASPEIRNLIWRGDIIDVAEKLSGAFFDIAICSEVLEHVPDPAATLSAIISLLAPGGKVIITVPGGMQHWSKQDEVAGHYRRFEYEELAALLRKCGLVIENQYGWGGPVSFIYNRLISVIGPEQVMKTHPGKMAKLISTLIISMLRIDDFFSSNQQFQLIARAGLPI